MLLDAFKQLDAENSKFASDSDALIASIQSN